MIKYDFDNVPDRRGSGCYKWDEAAQGVLPLWVADMDFKAAPFILDAVQRRLDHGVFGYTKVTEDYYEPVINWFRSRRGWEIKRESILYVPGVIPAIAATLKAFTVPGDKV
ncbi:MAG: cystathionine beta-lyase, partial [Bacteroidales bacterium]|nr:cystathionine beta-lyase [Bacteroidales bacterium]